jgi:hypothetical protein
LAWVKCGAFILRVAKRICAGIVKPSYVVLVGVSPSGSAGKPAAERHLPSLRAAMAYLIREIRRIRSYSVTFGGSVHRLGTSQVSFRRLLGLIGGRRKDGHPFQPTWSGRRHVTPYKHGRPRLPDLRDVSAHPERFVGGTEGEEAGGGHLTRPSPPSRFAPHIPGRTHGLPHGCAPSTSDGSQQHSGRIGAGHWTSAPVSCSAGTSRRPPHTRATLESA